MNMLDFLVLLPSSTSPYYAFKTCDAFGKGIVILLFLFSIVTWTIMIEKGIVLMRVKKASIIFARLFRDKKYVLSLFKSSEMHAGPLVKIYQAGADELLNYYNLGPESAEFYGSEKYPEQKLTTAQIETVRSILERAVADQILLVEDKIGLLATAVSVSPFFGLLGTVWGVMMAFCAMAIKGKADIGAMAPGIAGALLTTAVGLLVAIPSLIGYNLLTITIRQITVYMDNFVEEFMAKIKLEQH